jgi:hypothetical protein
MFGRGQEASKILDKILENLEEVLINENYKNCKVKDYISL